MLDLRTRHSDASFQGARCSQLKEGNGPNEKSFACYRISGPSCFDAFSEEPFDGAQIHFDYKAFVDLGYGYVELSTSWSIIQEANMNTGESDTSDLLKLS